MSLWPPRYFVVACITRSAPSRKGCCSIGVAQVLSQATRADARFAIPAIAAMSVTRMRGFDGVSTHSSRVAGRTAAATADGSVMSTSVASSPQWAKCSSSRSAVP